jgi:hypothetical protein
MTITLKFLKEHRGTYSTRKLLRLEVVDFLLTQPREDLRWFHSQEDMDHLLDMIVMTGGVSVGEQAKYAQIAAFTDGVIETLPTLSEGYKQDPFAVVPKKKTAP